MKVTRFFCTSGAILVLAGLGVGLAWQTPAPTAPAAADVALKRAAADGLGYSAAFDAELKKIGQITPQEFARRYAGKATYLPKLSWDPTTATYWDRFNLDPNQKGAQVKLHGQEELAAYRERAKRAGKPIPDGEPVTVSAWGGYDFRPNAEELARFKENGFVVSERMGGPSCTEIFYRVYKRDLPVFVSTDAVLHAWHRSYDAILVEVETSMLIPALADILGEMSRKVPDARAQYGEGLYREALADADYFLAVARSLLSGSPTDTALQQNERVAQTLKACADLQLQKFNLFGRGRDVDFSQFKPRGHYEQSETLRRYFRSMMWCGRIDLRVAGNPEESSPREMAAAVVLHDLLQRSGKFERWQQFDRMIQTFVGRADSMTFAQLGVVLTAAGVRTPPDLKDLDALTALQARIEAGKFGAQEIRGDVFVVDPSNPDRLILPRSFTFLGQRFALDSWVTSKVVYDDVLWNGVKVKRRIPSCLDVAFAALGNDHTVTPLVERMTSPAGREFRDGLNYQHNLAAVRQAIDSRPAAEWQENLYNGWLSCLRELSSPTTTQDYPETLRTRAWAMKSLNTQLASWTQLRHDTILYVKQSYTAVPGCYYPAGYVEPVPHFWARLEQMARRAAVLIEKTPYTQPAIQKKQVEFLRNFAGRTATLQAIAKKELAAQELNEQEIRFLEDVIMMGHVRFGSGSRRAFVGWYPGLFYAGSDDSLKWDALVADVHTDPPAPDWGDPGCVLHQGVGSVDLMLVAIDSGKDRMVYAGPVLSHYEFEMGGVSRRSDSEWKTELQAGRRPPRPEWTRSYLVPGENKEVQRYPRN